MRKLFKQIVFLMICSLMGSISYSQNGDRTRSDLPPKILSALKANGNRNGNEFAYSSPCGCSGNVYLKIYYGLDDGAGTYGGQAVAKGDKFTIGSVTIANKNDTDGDGTIDNKDTNVIAVNGRNELDLMKVEVIADGRFKTGCDKFKLAYVGANSQIAFWKTSTKGTIDDITQAVTINTNKKYSNTVIKTFWIEAKEESSYYKDIILKLMFLENGVYIGKDSVSATAIWVYPAQKSKYITYANSGIENSNATTLGIDQPILKNLIDLLYPSFNNERYGVGEHCKYYQAYMNNYISNSCNTIANNGIYSNYNMASSAGILTAFAFKPLLTLNQLNSLSVKFDFGRQWKGYEKKIDHSKYVLETIIDIPNYPIQEEYSTDDGGKNAFDSNGDEDLIPLDSLLFSLDHPGFVYDSYIHPSFAYFRRQINFREFARISFNQPLGGDSIIIGSRCSDFLSWDTEQSFVTESFNSANDKFAPCMHRLVFNSQNVVLSAIRRTVGNGNPIFNINLNQPTQNSVNRLQLKIDSSQKLYWVYTKLNASGVTTNNIFESTAQPGHFIFTDVDVKIDIINGINCLPADAYTFNIIHDIPNNSLH